VAPRDDAARGLTRRRLIQIDGVEINGRLVKRFE
jgi:hypothetical protein